jgi:hypothetical protein
MFSPKYWYIPVSPHGVTMQETNTNIITTIKINNNQWHYRSDGC